MIELSYDHLAREAKRLRRDNRRLELKLAEARAALAEIERPKRQLPLLTGLDCLPGQRDLFVCDGPDRAV
jgi:hypothetical protein